MFITDKKELEKYGASYRLWQGVPSIEVTGKGRIFSAFYSGGTKEQVNNFVMLIKSDDGTDFGKPIAVAFKENYRCYDPCLWIDPLKRLWFIWAVAPEHAVYAVICDNPDADQLAWSDVIKIGKDVMINKPTVLTTGEWLFPIAVWNYGVPTAGGYSSENEDSDRKAFVYKTIDNGKTFVKLGGSDVDKRVYDDHMIVERDDESLAMYVRTGYGIGISHSYDRGKTWTGGEVSLIDGPSTRFFIKKLKSGRMLLVYHKSWTIRNNLVAMLSEDEGKTWKYSLILDERDNVSYPDVKEADDGYIYITYDRERGSFLDSIDKVYDSAREILYAKVTEEDIINEAITDKNSKLKVVISKLGKYALEHQNPFKEIKRFSDGDLTKKLIDKTNEEIIDFIFTNYRNNCINMHRTQRIKLDSLVEELNTSKCDRERIVYEIITLVRSVNSKSVLNAHPTVERIKKMIQENTAHMPSSNSIADMLGMSVYYMCHLFKETTGITIGDYKKEIKITKAKSLLVNTDKKINEISRECGFYDDSYFSKMFRLSENLSPTQYREYAKICKNG